MTAREDLRRDLALLADPDRAASLRWYFKMEPGGYGEGDVALGIRVPDLRRLARRYWRSLSVEDAAQLLSDGAHEERLTALFVLTHHFTSGEARVRHDVVTVVLAHTERINNWDLVDAIAPRVLGPWLRNRDRTVLDTLASSPSVWERRLAIMATAAFIHEQDFDSTFHLADILLEDPHDLVRKAVGWMLREVGNQDRAAEEAFLLDRYTRMPRVMLRYAIEKFEPEVRRRYLDGTVAPVAET